MTDEQPKNINAETYRLIKDGFKADDYLLYDTEGNLIERPSGPPPPLPEDDD